MIRRIFSSCAAVAVLLMAETSAFAMTFMEPDKVMRAGYDVINQCIRGTVFMKTTDSDGTELTFNVHNEGDFEKNYASMESADGKTVYFTFPVGMRFQVKEIRTEDPERKFWLVQTGASVNTCEKTCLIGRYGDTYVKFVSLEDLQEEKLSGYASWWTVEDGEVVVRDWVSGRSGEVWIAGRMHSRVDEVRLFWDEEAEWVGIRYDRPVVYEKGSWFYTDEDGADYFLHRFRETSSWIYAQVIRKNADGERIPLLYYIYTYQVQSPYTIYDGTSSVSHRDAVERGFLYDGSDANLSAVALYERVLNRKWQRR